jgi:hypothetical protein
MERLLRALVREQQTGREPPATSPSYGAVQRPLDGLKSLPE